MSDFTPQTEDSDAKVADLSRQVQRYARDLSALELRERESIRQRDAVLAQLDRYCTDLRKALEMERHNHQLLEASYRDTLLRLNRAAQFRDDETGSHLDRLSQYCEVLSKHLGLWSEEVHRIAITAPMHDIGKIGIPDAVLLKPGPLTAEEWRVMSTHPGIGASLLRSSTSPLIETARIIALTHHERWDGSGYPQGLRGEEIPIPGRIVAVADVYDALRSQRPYKKSYSHSEACHTILQGDGRVEPAHFDPVVLKAFRELADQFDAIFVACGDSHDA